MDICWLGGLQNNAIWSSTFIPYLLSTITVPSAIILFIFVDILSYSPQWMFQIFSVYKLSILLSYTLSRWSCMVPHEKMKAMDCGTPDISWFPYLFLYSTFFTYSEFLCIFSFLSTSPPISVKEVFFCIRLARPPEFKIFLFLSKVGLHSINFCSFSNIISLSLFITFYSYFSRVK